MSTRLRAHLALELKSVADAGALRPERVIAGRTGPEVVLDDGRRALDFCSNDYLGLARSPLLAEAAKAALDARGFGCAAVRFTGGTLDLHRRLERRLAEFLGLEAAILYGSCFDANLGFFEPLLGEVDAILPDVQSHASLTDGARLSRARVLPWRHADLKHLEARLVEAAGARFRVVATDGVFTRDGELARLDAICELAARYDATVLVDDCHGTGVVGATGRGTPEHFDVRDRVDVVTGTFSKALGGASGGFVAGPATVVETLRRRSKPYLLSTSLPPAVVAGVLAALERITASNELRDRLAVNTRAFRGGLAQAGFDLQPGPHPIVPVLLYDAALALQFADDLLEAGVMVPAFVYPVVPKGEARIRAQVSAAHEPEQIARAIDVFRRVGSRHGVV